MVVGKALPTGALTEQEVRAICEEGLASTDLTRKRVLVLIPDNTRHAPIGLFFRIIHDLIGRKVSALDYLIATGTHHPMSQESIFRHVGITEEEYRTTYRYINFFNHAHDNPAELKTIGLIDEEELNMLSGGLLRQRVYVTINKHVFEYDHILIVSPVVPHETVGFSGGNKYFFPGIGGVEIIQTFHWIGAVITNLVVNGVKDTPVRRIINRAAAMVNIPKTCFAFTVEGKQVASLFAGTPEDAWGLAADHSSKIHIRYRAKPVKTVLGIAPAIYDDIWVAGKVMYKHEPIIADGGEVIIYAPHIKDVSFTHGKEIEKVGYHVPDYFLKQWDRFSAVSGLILAHSTNVKGIGTYENGIETPRVTVTLATSIPESVCKKINLGYRDPASIDVEKMKSMQGDDLLVVENAGQNLYRLRN